MGTKNQENDSLLLEEDVLTPEEEAKLRGDDYQGSDDDDDEGQNKDKDGPAIDPDILAEIADDRSPTVPHARFHEVNERNKELEARLAAIDQEREEERLFVETQQAKKAEESASASIKDKIMQHQELLYDGKNEEAAVLMMEIFSDQEKVATERARVAALQSVESASNVREFAGVVREIESSYPELDSKNSSANADAINDVNLWMQSNIDAGMTNIEALQAATQKAIKLYGLANDDNQPEKQTAKFSARANGDAANRIPPKMTGGMGDRNLKVSAVDIQKMTDKEFENLDPEVEKKLRGEA